MATKYGYFRPEDLERLCLPAPDWDNNKTVRRLIAQGWLRPWAFPGLIEDELIGALIVEKALSAPLRKIASNAGQNGPVVLERVKNAEFEVGYNAATNELVNMFDIASFT